MLLEDISSDSKKKKPPDTLMCRVRLHQNSHGNHIVEYTHVNIDGHGDFLRLGHSKICSDFIIARLNQFSLAQLNRRAGSGMLDHRKKL